MKFVFVMQDRIKPLYRKENTRVRAAWRIHNVGSDAKYDRHTKSGMKKSMKKNVERGLDYTPLYNYLISMVGHDWNEVHSYAIARLDKPDPIGHIVIKLNDISKGDGYVRNGESSYYSALYIDENNILQKVNPELKNEDLYPSCQCCTHTFNGKPLIRKWIEIFK